MADSSQVELLVGRRVVLAGEPGLLRDQAGACLAALGAESVGLQWDGETGPEVDEIKQEERLARALDRVAAALGNTDAIVYVGRDLRAGEDMAAFIEEAIGGFHFTLKLAKRLREKSATDVVALAGDAAAGEDAALAADIRNGALRQLCLVAASEGGPMTPPLLVNAVFASGEPGTAVSESLKSLLARLLARPQGYVTGTSLRVSL